jgi:hypothetical protein
VVSDLKADLRAYLRANMLDGDEGGVVAMSAADLLTEVTDLTEQWLAERGLLLSDQPRDGDVVVDAGGGIYQYSMGVGGTGSGVWYAFGWVTSYDDDNLVRPLTLIAREGKPAQGIVR